MPFYTFLTRLLLFAIFMGWAEYQVKCTNKGWCQNIEMYQVAIQCFFEIEIKSQILHNSVPFIFIISY